MARDFRLTFRPGGAWRWCAVASALGVGALLMRGVAPHVIDWQPALAASEPWRWWSAAWVHYSGLHLLANLAGALLVGLLGVVAQVRGRAALAWLLAWPATQLGLLIEPALLHYGGLSGALHAGVGIVAVHLFVEGGSARALALALLCGMLVKILIEAPWIGPVQHPSGWDIAVVPLAHATGAFAGVVCALLTLPTDRRPTTARHV